MTEKMILKKYNAIMQRDEAYRKKWALGLTITISAFIFVGFAFSRGLVSFNAGQTMAEKISNDQVATVVAADQAPSPLHNSKETFKAAFQEIDKQYQEIKKSISDVLVPFVTGIDVYERK